MPTIVSQIEVVEKELQLCESKLDKVERKIRISDLPKEQLISLKNKEEELKKEQKNHQAKLQTLRKENGKTTFLSFVLLGILVALYYTFWTS